MRIFLVHLGWTRSEGRIALCPKVLISVAKPVPSLRHASYPVRVIWVDSFQVKSIGRVIKNPHEFRQNFAKVKRKLELTESGTNLGHVGGTTQRTQCPRLHVVSPDTLQHEPLSRTPRLRKALRFEARGKGSRDKLVGHKRVAALTHQRYYLRLLGKRPEHCVQKLQPSHSLPQLGLYLASPNSFLRPMK